MSIMILRQRHEGEVLREGIESPYPGWDYWSDEGELSTLEEAAHGIIASIDIEECNGEPPSKWVIVVDGVFGDILDAAAMTSEQRTGLVSQEAREEGHEIMGDMIKEEVDEALDRLEQL